MNIKRVISSFIGSNGVIKIKELKLFYKNPIYKALLRQNKEFKNKHKGERCFVIGNGPSLSGFDLSLLKEECTFSVNQLSRRCDFKELNTNYHFWVDHRFFSIDDNNPGDIELLDTMRNVKTSTNSPIVFYSLEAFSLIKKYHLDEELDIRYIGLESLPVISTVKHDIDFSKLTLAFPTVVQTVICMATYMGFKEIYLLGCDCTGFITIAQAHLNSISNNSYGYSLSENEKERMLNSSKLTSIRNELKWYVDLFDQYHLLNTYCKKRGVKLYNATDGGLLECIERVNVYDILGIN